MVVVRYQESIAFDPGMRRAPQTATASMTVPSRARSRRRRARVIVADVIIMAIDTKAMVVTVKALRATCSR